MIALRRVFRSHRQSRYKWKDEIFDRAIEKADDSARTAERPSHRSAAETARTAGALRRGRIRQHGQGGRAVGNVAAGRVGGDRQSRSRSGRATARSKPARYRADYLFEGAAQARTGGV